MHKCNKKNWIIASEIAKKEVMRNREKGYVLAKKNKGKKDEFKLLAKFIIKWQKSPRRRRNNTYNYTLSHICRVRGFQYLRQ